MNVALVVFGAIGLLFVAVIVAVVYCALVLAGRADDAMPSPEPEPTPIAPQWPVLARRPHLWKFDPSGRRVLLLDRDEMAGVWPEDLD